MAFAMRWDPAVKGWSIIGAATPVGPVRLGRFEAMNTTTPMTTITLATGAVLTVLGIAGYASTGAASLTALIPSLVGALILVCGVLARQEEQYRTPSTLPPAVALVKGGVDERRQDRQQETSPAPLSGPAMSSAPSCSSCLPPTSLWASGSFIAAREAVTSEALTALAANPGSPPTSAPVGGSGSLHGCGVESVIAVPRRTCWMIRLKLLWPRPA